MLKNIKTEITHINELDFQEWNCFLNKSTESTYFCTTDYCNSFKNARFLQVRNSENNLIAGIPFRTQISVPFIGNFFNFSRIDSSVIVSQDYEQSEIYRIKKIAFHFLLAHLKKEKVIFLYISPMTRSHDAAILSEIGFKTDKSATLIIDLRKDTDDLFNSFSKSNRNKIRQAQKKDVQIKFFQGESAMPYISTFNILQARLFEHKKDSYSSIYFKSESYINKIFLSKFSQPILAMAFYQSKPAASTILLPYKDSIYSYLSATDHQLIKESGASNLLRYEIIRFAKEKGYSFHDMGGIPYGTDPSIDTYGVYIFKKSFGGERQEYDIGSYVLNKFRYKIIVRLQKYQNHPFFRAAYQLIKQRRFS